MDGPRPCDTHLAPSRLHLHCNATMTHNAAYGPVLSFRQTQSAKSHIDNAQQRTDAHCPHRQNPLLPLSSFHFFGSLAGCHDHHNQSKFHTRSEVTPQATFTSSSPTPTSQKQNKDTNVTFTFLLPIPLTEFPFIGSVFHPPRPHYHLTLPYSRFPFTFICR